MGDVIKFPKKPEEPKVTKLEKNDGPYETLVHQGDTAILVSKGHNFAAELPFPYPSAPAVDPRYLKAIEEQRKKDD